MDIKTIPQAIDDMAVSLGASPSAQIPTISQALENVYTALGGTRTDLDTMVISEVIDLLTPLVNGGGGGSSDFTTAELTVIVKNVGESTIPANNSIVDVLAPLKMWNGKLGKNVSGSKSGFDTASDVATNGTYQGVFDVILYDGVCIFSPFGFGSQYIAVTGSVTGSGDVTIDQETGDATVTGNATLTLECEYFE